MTNTDVRKVKVILEGFDVMSTVSYIGRMNKKRQAELLAGIENILGPNSSEYRIVRKMVLDATNDLARDLIKNIFGDIDF